MSKRRNERVSNGYRRRMLRQRVLAAYDVCAICGKPVDKTLKTPHPMSAEVDELIPVSRGGDPYSFTNCRLTHRRCNSSAGNAVAAGVKSRATYDEIGFEACNFLKDIRQRCVSIFVKI